MKQIEIRISPEGSVKAETLNMEGHVCQKYLKSIEFLTNSVAVDSSYKEEFYKRESENVDVNQNVAKIIRNGVDA